MGSTDLEAIEAIERDANGLFHQLPTFISRVRWLCALAKGFEKTESVLDDRDVALKAAHARIATLESRLNLTPEAVLSLERAELTARGKGAPIVEDEK